MVSEATADKTWQDRTETDARRNQVGIGEETREKVKEKKEGVLVQH